MIQKQLSLFEPLKYDHHLIFLRSNIFKISPLLWDWKQIESLPTKWLRVMCIRFKLPYTGTRLNLLQQLYAFKDLANLVKINTDVSHDKKSFVIKESSKLKEIVPVMNALNIRHSWLNKRQKLKLCIKKLNEAWHFKPQWSNYKL